METVKRFRLVTIRVSILVSVVAGLVLIPFSRAAGLGVLMGGIAGALGFWVLAIRLEKVAPQLGDKVKWFAYRWTLVRLALYALVLYQAYALDRETLHGLLGAVGGLLIIRMVLIIVGITGFDLKREEN